jgi:F-type H+-transporting ATPase subunit alpha
MRSVAGKLKLDLAQYEEVARFARFGTEVDEATQRQIQRGMRLEAALKQNEHDLLSLAEQVVVLTAATSGYLDDVPPEEVPAFEQRLLSVFKTEYAEIGEEIDASGELSEASRETLRVMLTECRASWGRRSRVAGRSSLS